MIGAIFEADEYFVDAVQANWPNRPVKPMIK